MGFNAAYVSWYTVRKSLPPAAPALTAPNISVMNARVPSRPAATWASVCNDAPRPGTSFAGLSAAIASSVAGQSLRYASPVYGVV